MTVYIDTPKSMDNLAAPQTRFEALPQQVQDDLFLVLYWTEHYAPRDEQEAVNRLTDYFAEQVQP